MLLWNRGDTYADMIQCLCKVRQVTEHQWQGGSAAMVGVGNIQEGLLKKGNLTWILEDGWDTLELTREEGDTADRQE